MKRANPDPMADDHVRVKEVARIGGVSESTALRIMKRHPLVRYLPLTDTRGRHRRTPILPRSAVKDLWVRQ